jgi:aerotaxis receptor
MKKNFPVTNQERDFSERATILSTTDPKGIITYANQDFIDICGYSADELLAKNHNIVRHPDMPPAAFGNLWDTIKTGAPWMGVVKNRCKNGDHYWVDAYVTPIMHNGEVVEYQSVRHKAKREWISRAEETYKSINDGTRIRALAKTLSLNTKLLLIAFLSFLPLLALLFMVETPSMLHILGAVTLSLVIICLGNRVALTPLGRVIKEAYNIFDNPLMRYVYTGRTDDIGQLNLAMKMAQSELRAVVGRMSDTMEHLSTASSSTASNVTQTSHGMSHQRNEITQVVTAMTEMSATVQEVARNAAEAATTATQGQAKADKGSSEIDQVISAIAELAKETEQAALVISRLGESSNRIGSVLDVIKGIADQTNLLALNAAIEAARAGEQGRGFAVVADEVRSLAVRTQEATGEIQQMIEQLQQESKLAVQVMEQGRDMARTSAEKGAQARDTFKAIAQEVSHISNMNTLIATAVEEQSAVAEEINRNLININGVTDETSDSAFQASDVMSRLAEEMEHAERLIKQLHQSRTQAQ